MNANTEMPAHGMRYAQHRCCGIPLPSGIAGATSRHLDRLPGLIGRLGDVGFKPPDPLLQLLDLTLQFAYLPLGSLELFKDSAGIHFVHNALLLWVPSG